MPPRPIKILKEYLPQVEIIRLHNEDHLTHVVTTRGTFKVAVSMVSIVARLDPGLFTACSPSDVVNWDHITEVYAPRRRRMDLLTSDGAIIHVSVSNQRKFRHLVTR